MASRHSQWFRFLKEPESLSRAAVEFAQMAQYPAFRTIASEPRYATVMRAVGLPR
jgi:hypothetical protein